MLMAGLRGREGLVGGLSVLACEIADLAGLGSSGIAGRVLSS
jgi:hypothetical protein